MIHLPLTPAEVRAFQFGPAMRRAANADFGGNLDRAHRSLATLARVEQHWEDVHAIRLPLRRAYTEACAKA